MECHISKFKRNECLYASATQLIPIKFSSTGLSMSTYYKNLTPLDFLTVVFNVGITDTDSSTMLLLTCKQSTIAEGSSSSIAPMSLENLFSIRPVEQ
jgi:hypothetical protein